MFGVEHTHHKLKTVLISAKKASDVSVGTRQAAKAAAKSHFTIWTHIVRNIPFNADISDATERQENTNLLVPVVTVTYRITELICAFKASGAGSVVMQ